MREEEATSSSGAELMGRVAFMDAVFELADMWTATIQISRQSHARSGPSDGSQHRAGMSLRRWTKTLHAQEYTDFLWALLDAVAIRMPPDLRYFWRQLGDVGCVTPH